MKTNKKAFCPHKNEQWRPYITKWRLKQNIERGMFEMKTDWMDPLQNKYIRNRLIKTLLWEGTVRGLVLTKASKKWQEGWDRVWGCEYTECVYQWGVTMAHRRQYAQRHWTMAAQQLVNMSSVPRPRDYRGPQPPRRAAVLMACLFYPAFPYTVDPKSSTSLSWDW